MLYLVADRRERCGGHRQIRFRRRQRHVHGRHQRDEPIDRLIVEMALVDAGIGDEMPLRPETKPDALGDAGKRRGDRRTNGTIENPYLLKAAAPQPRDEQEHIEPAAQLRAGMPEIERLGDARLGREQFLRAARRRRQKRHAAPGRRRGDGADERKVPDDVADARFDLDDRARGHIDCRAKGCDMPF